MIFGCEWIKFEGNSTAWRSSEPLFNRPGFLNHDHVMTTSINTFRTLFVSLSSISVVLLLTMSISAQTTTTSSGGTAVQFPNNPAVASSYMDNEKEGVYARFTDFPEECGS